MATTSQVETVSTAADKAKLAVAVALVVGAIAAFYLLGQKDLWMRVLALLVLACRSGRRRSLHPSRAVN